MGHYWGCVEGFALLIGPKGWGINLFYYQSCLACRGGRLVHFSSFLCPRVGELKNFSIEVREEYGAREWFPGSRPSEAFFFIPLNFWTNELKMGEQQKGDFQIIYSNICLKRIAHLCLYVFFYYMCIDLCPVAMVWLSYI